jgi:hypothetical protein
MNNNIVIAILARNKEHTLPLYLECISNLDYNKKNILLYIRTNDNTDNTTKILEEFIRKNKSKYNSIYYNKRSISEELKNYQNHEWNTFRFKVLSKIRKDSINYAIAKKCHYFVVDCDNYITPQTLKNMVTNKSLGVIAPMLISNTLYSNFHYDVDDNGYYKDHPNYLSILKREMRGFFDVKLVHCTYFINNSLLKKIIYDDESFRYEYVIFSDNLRNLNIPQYIDNREFYGFLNFEDTHEDFSKNVKSFSAYFSEFLKYKKPFPNLIKHNN